jgi:hypothetical protein
MRSVEGKEEVYPSRIWEAKLEPVSLHYGENLASALSVRAEPATPKTMGGDQVERSTPERQGSGARRASLSQQDAGTSLGSDLRAGAVAVPIRQKHHLLSKTLAPLGGRPAASTSSSGEWTGRRGESPIRRGTPARAGVRALGRGCPPERQPHPSDQSSTKVTLRWTR